MEHEPYRKTVSGIGSSPSRIDGFIDPAFWLGNAAIDCDVVDR